RAQVRPARQEIIRRQIVSFGHDNIDPYRQRAEPMRGFDQLGEARARPRPTTEGLEAALVDIDNHDGKTRYRAGHETLVGVEDEIARGAPKTLARRDMKQSDESQQRR